MKNILIAIALLICRTALAQCVHLPFTINQPLLFFDKSSVLQKAGVKWVNCIFKDSHHFLWFGTANGLFRFDGTNVVYQAHRVDDTLSLPGNNVVSIAEDRDGFLWVGTTIGAAKMDPGTFACKSVTDTLGNFLGYKLKFYIDKENNVWAATDGGLFKYNVTKQAMQAVWQAAKGQHGNGYYLQDITSWSNDELVAGTDAGVVFINKHNFSFRRLPISKKDTELVVSKVYVDSDNELWVGTWGEGLLHFNNTKQTFSGIKWEADAVNNVDNIVNAVTKVNTGGRSFVYVGTPHGLLKIGLAKDGYTTVKKNCSIYVNRPNDEASIMAGSVSAFLKDGDGVLWVGSDDDIGVARFSVNESLFYTLPIKHAGFIFSMNTFRIDGKKYYAICNWHNQTGLKLLDESLHEVTSFARLPAKSGPDAVDIASVSADIHNNLWVASWKGITILDKHFNIIKTLDHTSAGPDTLTREKVNYAMANGDSVWIASYKNGIDLFTTGFKRLKHYALGDQAGLKEDLVWRFYQDTKHRTWLLGNAFLYRYHRQKDVFEMFSFSADKAQYKPYDMAEKKDGSFVLASENGLIHFNANTGQYQYIRCPLLQQDVPVSAVTVDENDNVWYTTGAHLVFYNFVSKTFILYGKEDGLDPADGLYTLTYIGHDSLLIGQENKLVVFKAPTMIKKVDPPVIRVTALHINDSLVSEASFSQGLVLNYNENHINIEFTCIGFIKPEQNIFAYRLNNADTGWTYTPKGNVTYAGLSPGHYVFQVKAANYLQRWSNPISVSIYIKPPVWQRWWFVALAALLALAATNNVFRWRVSRVRKAVMAKAAVTKQIAQLEMKALRAQMNPHFVFNSLSSIQESIVTGKTAAASKYLSKFSKLIRLVLENSGKQFIPLKSEIESLTLYLELESFRFENFTYAFSIDPLIDEERILVPSMIIQPFVENALKHGFATKIGDKQLNIDIHWELQQLIATIEDNGTGRPGIEVPVLPERRDHHSMGIQITEERLKLIDPENHTAKSIFITDLKDAAGKAAGTHVKIILPFEK